MSKATHESELFWQAALPARARAKFLAGPVRAFERHARGALSFHGGAMALDGMAICVLGVSGAGKSTCVYDACTRGPWTFVADDVSHVDLTDVAARVHSTELVAALTHQSVLHFGLCATGDPKLLLDAPETRLAAAPLKAFVDLAFGDSEELHLAPLKGLQAVGALMASQVRLVLASISVHAHDMDAIERLLARVPVLRLTRPRALGRLAQAESLLAKWVQEQGERVP